MNLTNLFNYNFLKENIKRSKAIILLIILLIPVINVIYYLMQSTNSNIIVPDPAELQPLSILGIYIVPVILSITLFSFIFKRKSSDFVMSFPVSKKQVFLSNTLGGILIILAMNIVNYLFTLITTLLLNNVLIDYRMLFDMFVLWTVTYIFVFTCTNIAVSISSNKITTVVVTLLVLFLVPFVHTFITSNSFKGTENSDISTYCNNEICRPKNYKCYSTACEINKRKDIYSYTYYEEIETNKNYTIPYYLIYSSVLGDDNANVNNSVIKMAFLSILYIVIGFVFFIKKKFEVVGTSFKNEKLHIIIRSLTTIPIICIYYIILKNSNIGLSDIFTITFLVVLLIAYIIIYDLLTRKKITNMIKSLCAIIIVGIFVVIAGELSSSNDINQINVNDIDKMTIMDYNMINKNGYTMNKDIINYIISIHIDNIKGEENYYNSFDIRILVDKKTYEFRILTTKEQYEYILNALKNDETYQKTSNKIKNKNIFAIELKDNNSYVLKENDLYNEIIEKFQNSTTIRNENSESLFNTELYIYDNFEVTHLTFKIEDNNLKEKILNHYNEEVKEVFNDPDIDIHSYYIGEYNITTETTNEDYLSGYYQNENTEINNFILDNLDKKVDINKPYKYIRFYTSGLYNNSHIFVTNNVEELNTLIEQVKQKEQEEKNNIGDTYDEYTY